MSFDPSVDKVVLPCPTGTAAEWAASSAVLPRGVWGLASDTLIVKIGDGLNTWTGLPSYSAPAGYDLRQLQQYMGLPLPTYKMSENSGSVHPSLYREVSVTQGVTYEFTVVARRGERSNMNLYGAGFNVDFDLVMGTCFATSGSGSMKILGGGWFECKATGVAPSTTGVNFQLRPSAMGLYSYTGDGTSGLYVDTLSASLVGGANIWASNNPSNAIFTKQDSSVVSANSPADPLGAQVFLASASTAALDVLMNGSMTGWSFVEASGSVSPSVYRSYLWVSGSAYVVDCYAKANTRSRLNLYSNGGAVFDCTFDLLRGICSGTGSSILHVGNGWYRCRVSVTASASSTSNLQMRMFPNAGGVPYTGDGTSGLFVQDCTLTKDGGLSVLSDSSAFSSAWYLQNVSVTAAQALYVGLRYAPLPSVVAHPLAGKKVTMVGTSLIDHGVLTAAFALETGAVVQKLGYSGGALGLDARATPHYGSGQVTALFPSINSDAQVILLDMEVGDIAASDVPLGAIGDTTTATYYGALANFFSWCKTNRPDAAVCVVVPTSADMTYSPSDYHHGVPNANGNTVEDFQIATRRAALYAGRPYIDPNSYGIGYLDMETGEATVDGLHWDVSGAAKVAKIYAKQMADFCEAGWLVTA